MCDFVVSGLVFSIPSREVGLGTSPKWPILCWVGRKTTTQSIKPEWVKEETEGNQRIEVHLENSHKNGSGDLLVMCSRRSVPVS